MNSTLLNGFFIVNFSAMRRHISFFGFIILLLVTGTTINLDAQNRRRATDQDYYRIAWRAKQPQSFIQHTLLPSSDSLNKVLFGYSFSYDFLQFKKSGKQYSTTLAVNVDIYRTSENEAEEIEKLERKEREENRKALERGRRPNLNALRDERLERIEEMIPVQTIVLRDTIKVETYEATSSTTGRVEGNFISELPNGIYRYRIEVRQNGAQKPLQSRFRTLRILKDTVDTALIVGELSSDSSSFRAFNMDGRIPFGTDFDILYYTKNRVSADSLIIEIEETKTSTANKSDSTIISSTQQTILPLKNQIKLVNSIDALSQTIIIEHETTNLFVIKVNGRDLKNAQYQIEIKNISTDQLLTKKLYNSFWSDMPLSLYDVNIAIDMMRFIIKEEEVEALKKGSNEEKIRHFEEFWDKRDPTPDTDYNELMAEYYRRVDYAFEQFSSPSIPGFESDMGKYYILMGPPTSTERKLLGNNQTRIEWDYPKVQLIFQSTSGFGDYQLIERKSK